MKKRIVSLLLALVFVAALTPLPASRAAASYDPGKAITYAKAHWNDGKGLCAEFVSRCVQAGGLNMPLITTAGKCLNTASSVSGVAVKTLTLDKNGYATKAANGNILAAGDVVAQYCKGHDKYPHVMLCGGYSSAGRATFYGHAAATNNTEQQLNINEAYEHTRDCEIVAKVVHLSGLGGSTTPVPPTVPSVKFALPTQTAYKDKQKVASTNAVVVNQITKPAGTAVTKMGVYLYDASGKQLKKFTENVSNVAASTTVYHSWYDINKEVGYTLTPGTTYRYAFFGVFNGSEVKGGTYSFTTTGSAPAKTFDVYYALSESTCEIRPVTQGKPYGSMPAGPSRTGYTFAGWFTSSAGGTQIFPTTVFNGSANVYLYPHYTKDPDPVLPEKNVMTLQIGSPYLYVNGSRRTIDGEGTVPVLRNNRTMLPVRAVMESMGGTVGWNNATRTVSSSKGGKTFFLQIGNTRAWDAAGQTHWLDTAPVIINNRTMLPIRYVVEFFGGDVSWNNATRTVSITW